VTFSLPFERTDGSIESPITCQICLERWRIIQKPCRSVAMYIVPASRTGAFHIQHPKAFEMCEICSEPYRLPTRLKSLPDSTPTAATHSIAGGCLFILGIMELEALWVPCSSSGGSRWSPARPKLVITCSATGVGVISLFF